MDLSVLPKIHKIHKNYVKIKLKVVANQGRTAAKNSRTSKPNFKSDDI